MSIIGLLGAGLLEAALLVGAAGIPPNPGRPTPPPGLEERARKTGEQAPPIVLPGSSGGTFALKDALGRGPVALVFYRGFW